MTMRDDVLDLRIKYCKKLGEIPDLTGIELAARIAISGFIGELDAILMKNPKEKDEHE